MAAARRRRPRRRREAPWLPQTRSAPYSIHAWYYSPASPGKNFGCTLSMTGYPAGFCDAPYGSLTKNTILYDTFRGDTKNFAACRGATMRLRRGFSGFRGEKMSPRDASCCTHRPRFLPLGHLATSAQTPRKAISANLGGLNGFLWHLNASRELLKW